MIKVIRLIHRNDYQTRHTFTIGHTKISQCRVNCRNGPRLFRGMAGYRPTKKKNMVLPCKFDMIQERNPHSTKHFRRQLTQFSILIGEYTFDSNVRWVCPSIRSAVYSIQFKSNEHYIFKRRKMVLPKYVCINTSDMPCRLSCVFRISDSLIRLLGFACCNIVYSI